MPAEVSVVVPVLNSPAELTKCLDALLATRRPGVEIIVVDDGSTDETAIVAARAGVRLVRSRQTLGPAAARNRGAREASAEVLFFVDADVVVAPDAIERVVRMFAECPDVAAVFGSYDARPVAGGLVSQYRNLLHHFVHQQGKREASTFWAGCGAIRRAVFEALGGFDAERFRHPCIEDIELGVRMRRAGYRIVLDKELQGTHLKRWTLASVIRTDVTRRAMPWAQLILESGALPDDLNLRHRDRLSGLLVVLACAGLPVAAFRPWWGAVSGLALLVVLGLNWELYRFFARRRGVLFAAACIPLHVLYYLYSVASYAIVWVDVRLGGRARGLPSRGATGHG